LIEDEAQIEEEPGGMEIQVESGPDDEADELVELPDELPVLPLKNTVLFPYLLSPLLVNTPASQRLIDDVLVRSDRLMVCTAVKRDLLGPPGADDVYSVGTVLRIVKMLKFPDDSYRLLVQGVARVQLGKFTAEEPFLRAEIQRIDETGEDDESVEMTALVRSVAQQFSTLVSESSRLSDELQVLVANLGDPSKLSDLVASNLDLDVAGKQQILEANHVGVRLRLVLDQLSKETEALQIETEIKQKVQNEMGKTQREYMLRQQLEAIRRELGESEDDEEEVERLRAEIEAAGMPEEALKQATRELERFAQTPSAAAEHAVIRNYLDWVVALPWSESSEDKLDVKAAREVLDADHFGLEKIKDRIIEYIAVLSLKRDLKGPILCFVGPPGTGKTSLGKSVARALGREFVRISLGGVRDEAEVRGHRRTYVGALPGRFIQGLRKAGTRNPVIVLDEIDKVGADGRGDPSSALEVPFDLSQVLFIATANVMDTVPPALQDRMEVIELPGYTLEEKIEIARGFLIPRQIERNGIGEAGFELTDAGLRKIIESYTREAGVRSLEREIGAVCRKVARRVAEAEPGAKQDMVIDEDGVSDLLGPIKAEPDLAEDESIPGVAVGLAWTPSGGDILFIESAEMPGKGELKLTGSMGEVMRESVEAARSWLRSHADTFGIDPKSIDSHDIHLHVPQGAVPKDGPSAGVGMVSSLASLLTGRSTVPRVAMTGEITLRGKVLPVGGIKEKVLAAKRAGIERVVLPERNRRDVEEISSDLLDGLELCFVGTIEEALQYTLREASPN